MSDKFNGEEILDRIKKGIPRPADEEESPKPSSESKKAGLDLIKEEVKAKTLHHPPHPSEVAEDIIENSKDVFKPKDSLSSDQMWIRAGWLLEKKDLVPAGLNTREKIFIAYELAKALGADSWGQATSYVSNIYIVAGRPNFFGGLPLAIVRESGELDYIREYFIDEEEKEIKPGNGNTKNFPWACVCEIKRKGDKLKTFFLTRDDLETRGCKYDKDNKTFVKIVGTFNPKRSETWYLYPKHHWMYATRRIALNAIFSDKLLNISGGDEDEAKTPEDKVVKKVKKPYKLPSSTYPPRRSGGVSSGADEMTRAERIKEASKYKNEGESRPVQEPETPTTGGLQ